MKVVLISFLAILSSCTYSIALVHTEGQATDVVDSTSTPTSEVSLPLNSI